MSHLVLFALPLAGLVGSGALAADQANQLEVLLLRQAKLASAIVEPSLAEKRPEEWAEVEPVLQRVYAETGVGIRILDREGHVRATSGPSAELDFRGFTEVEAALAGRTGRATRDGRSASAGEESAERRWSYGAIPLRQDGKVVGAIVALHGNRTTPELARDLLAEVGAASLTVMLAALGAAAWLGWRLSRAVRALAIVAEAVGSRITPPFSLADVRRSRVAEVRLVATALQEMLDRLEERLRYNQDFAANVSHEFKTPLTTLRGTVDLLAEDTEMPPEQRSLFLENARTDLDRLVRMVQGLLDLARADNRATQKRLDLAAVAAAIHARHPTIEVELNPVSVLGDPTQIELALTNLVENARRHGGPTVKLRVSSEGLRAVVEVEDDGLGISPANQQRVFDRFFTTGAEREGTGLGLSLVRTIARSHGGDTTVESRPGRTVFRFVVPRA